MLSGTMRRLRVLSVFASLLAVGCGGPSTPIAQSDPPATVGGETSASELTSACAALRTVIEEDDARELRARAEARAEDYGITPEEVLAEWAEEEDEQAPSTWSCPAENPGSYLHPPAHPPRALPGGGSAQLLAMEGTHESGERDRFLYLVVRVPGQPLRFERIGRTSDPGHGQEWAQLVVTAFRSEGLAIEIDADYLECVPAGFTEELEDEPPACRAEARSHIRCVVDDAALRCERTEEDAPQ